MELPKSCLSGNRLPGTPAIFPDEIRHFLRQLLELPNLVCTIALRPATWFRQGPLPDYFNNIYVLLKQSDGPHLEPAALDLFSLFMLRSFRIAEV